MLCGVCAVFGVVLAVRCFVALLCCVVDVLPRCVVSFGALFCCAFVCWCVCLFG